MDNNITQEDMGVLIDFLGGMPILTQSQNVRMFEKEWSDWLGVEHSVYVNSGATANFITMMVLKEIHGPGEIIVPTLTWVSDIASVLQNGFSPVFVDINPKTLCMDEDEILAKITPHTKAVFLTHVQGFNGLTDRLLDELEKRDIPLIEDVCESHGALHKGRKLGSFGLVSNFSFYFAHHLSTIEGGMICTNDDTVYNMVRMMRSHGMVREADDQKIKDQYVQKHPDLSPDFIFAYPSFNFRGTEIGAVIGRNQLKRLDSNNEKRRANFNLFLMNLDAKKYWTEFDCEGSCNYAFNLVLRQPDTDLREKVETRLRQLGVEFRRGSAGGGNQLRQPYLREIIEKDAWLDYPCVDHVHFFGYYIGNYPDLKEDKIMTLCQVLNSL
ncbi:MAG: DegT/DnrJ/EryC1/StrS family aminotransferase [Phycisphaeraceae bacterium]|nr:DegT/DnrJ/EryC1/StrS family aminotransferase [Phycisphaeraceae bacterium]